MKTPKDREFNAKEDAVRGLNGNTTIDAKDDQIVPVDLNHFNMNCNLSTTSLQNMNHKEDAQTTSQHIKQEFPPSSSPIKDENCAQLYGNTKVCVKQESLHDDQTPTDSAIRLQQNKVNNHAHSNNERLEAKRELFEYKLEIKEEPLHFPAQETDDDPHEPSSCKVCGYTSTHQADIEHHISTAHPVVTYAPERDKQAFADRQGQTGRVYLCHQCGYKATNRQTFVRHARAGRDSVSGLLLCRTRYKDSLETLCCTLCDFTTKNGEKLHDHTERTHLDNASAVVYRCPQCEYTTKSKRYYAEHTRKKHDAQATVYKCPDCRFTSHWRHRVTQHRKQVHDAKATVFRCPWCEFSTRYGRNLRKHQQMRHGVDEAQAQQYSCPHCDFSSPHKAYLAQHVHCLHSGEMLACDSCPFTTRWRSSLLKHVQYMHGETFRCDQCDYATEDRRQMAEHRRSGHAHKCHLCEYSTRWRQKLRQHMGSKHGEEGEVHACSLCPYRTRWRCALLVHARARHGAEGGPRHECKLCGYATLRRYSLLRHTRMKHGDDEALCKEVEEAGAAARGKRGRKDGGRGGGGEEMYKCEWCSYSNSSRHNKDRHVLLKHTPDGEVFRCATCDYETRYRGYLMQHFKRRHNKGGAAGGESGGSVGEAGLEGG